ncbi:amidohydrolase family protein [Actinomycetes bacterium M1A6_2h]
MLTLTGASHIVRTPGSNDPDTEAGGNLYLDGGTVADGPVDGPTLDVSGAIITPGLVNAHHHLLQSAFRTLPGTRGVPMSRWLPTMSAAYNARGVTPELAYAAARAGLAESLLCGVTTVADHHLTWPATMSAGETLALANATRVAAHELSARLVFVRGSARDDPDQAGLSAETIASAWFDESDRGVSEDGMLQLAVGPAGVHSDSRATFDALASVSRRFGLRRRTQANEQVDVAIALAKYGRRPIDLLDEWGWLADDVTLAHLCGVTDAEIDRLAAAGVTATHAPGCDLPMGWGIAPVASMVDRRMVVGLGTSGGGSNDAGHLLADARLAMQVAPLVGRPISAREVLSTATFGSAAGLGRSDLGTLLSGSAADVCVWDVDGVADSGVADSVAGLLWACPGRRPRHVIVGGRIVVQDYALISADEREIARALTVR